ncbi:magnesium transporter [Shewanella sp. C32]|uniref:Magnesium transporter n=1 Tax=Shewanella electrica TaxID=515560 RepID=A0ABT2FJP1_9GAMM|nr:magnesium transporter [Shewanella electrica]MCH1924654.1 magnesium transporter [Shewanella electrica]MCS4556555.1 magnesium transporter [Shewanella electrica]
MILSDSNIPQEEPIQDVGQMIQAVTQADGVAQAEIFDEVLEELDAGTIALLLESLPLEQRYQRWLQVEESERVDVLSEMRAEARFSILRQLDEAQLDSIFASLTPEAMIDWSDSLPDRYIERALEQVSHRHRERYALFDQYTDNQIGRYVDHQLLALTTDATVMQAQRFFRRTALDCCSSLFLVDDQDKYVASINRYQVFRAEPDAKLVDIVEDEWRVLRADMSLLDAVEAIEHSAVTELPVVDADGVLIGRLTLRTATALVREHYEAQMMAHAGMDESADLFAPVFSGAKRRAVWLGINLLTAFLASATIGMFENVLAKVVALAVLMPIVASMGGIAGSQTLTLMIRGMAMGQISIGNLFALFRNELAIGAINGVAWSLVIGAVAGWWFADPMMGITIGIAILINLVIAAMAGVAIPMILQKLNQDAALSGSVILTTVTDVVGFFAFLGVASMLYL